MAIQFMKLFHLEMRLPLPSISQLRRRARMVIAVPPHRRMRSLVELCSY